MRHDGGPVFPIAAGDCVGEERAHGMSLRDYFAAHSGVAIQLHAFTGADGQIELLDPSSVTAEAQQRIADWKAKFSYQIADAMLKEREKQS